MSDILEKIFTNDLLENHIDALCASYSKLNKSELTKIVNEQRESSNSLDSFKLNFENTYKRLSDMEEIDRRILQALNSDKYQARTIDGISQEANSSEQEIIQRITYSEKLSDLLKIYPRKSKDGQVLITTKAKYEKSASFTDKFIDAFATSRVRLDQ